MQFVSILVGSVAGLYLAAAINPLVAGYLFYQAPTTIPLTGVVRTPELERDSFIFQPISNTNPLRIRYDENTRWSALSLLVQDGVVLGATLSPSSPSQLREELYATVRTTIDRVGISTTDVMLIENL